jgi:hypothetical protein
MERPGGFYVIALGDGVDAGGFPGPLYMEEHEGTVFALPVFFSPETLERYADGIADHPQPESGTVAELRAGRFRAVCLEGERELFEATTWAGADCLVWDPAPGDEVRQVYRLPK